MGKEEILRSVRKNKPTLIPLPEINLDTFNETIDLLTNFKEKVALVGGTIKELSALNEIDREITKLFPNARNIVDCTKSSSLGTVSISEKTQPQDLEGVDLAIIPGAFGVAENGAIWISDDRFPIRILPFITKDLLIVLEKKNVCLHLHDAYELLSKRDRSFGVFVSGPSKTADIEQCLVIGAQGALSLTVVLV